MTEGACGKRISSSIAIDGLERRHNMAGIIVGGRHHAAARVSLITLSLITRTPTKSHRGPH
jgi:hypothetical protein